ncbi:hypothetical protein CBR_g29616 [Chara braunii]|uniref:Uncharacterized protein n=1 Tax=Chara braunii TaxID=69332 RepID=A0A388LAX8_CHABU|nr:hypothetical protein CBR_g29616 [Chara braunii]|eukprot:GBG79470.1 hypothetical protein CBR_g29616 [Chara braunii]
MNWTTLSSSEERDEESSESEDASGSGVVNSSEEVVEVVSSKAMLWKKRGREGADLGIVEVIVEVDKRGFDWGGMVDDCVTAGVVALGERGGGVATVEVVVDEDGGDVDVEVEAEACPEEGVVWGVEEGGVVVVTTMMVGVFPSSVVTWSHMADMLAFMSSREAVTEVRRVLSAWRMAERSGVAVFAGGCSPARLRAMLSIESVRMSDMLMEDAVMSGEEGVEDAAETDVEDAAAVVAAAAAAAAAAARWEFLVWRGGMWRWGGQLLFARIERKLI